MYIQFNVDLDAGAKQAKTIATQRRIDNLDTQYYGGLIVVMFYNLRLLNGKNNTLVRFIANLFYSTKLRHTKLSSCECVRL
jgi:hypothetical protein